MAFNSLTYVDVAPGEAVRVAGDSVAAAAYVNGGDTAISLGLGTNDQVASTGIYTKEIYATTTLASGGTALAVGDEIVITGNSGSAADAVTIVRVVNKTAALETAVADDVADDNPNSVLGRLLTVEKNQTDVLMPRLRRALGLLGEYQVADAFVYDDDGNITKCRIRVFNNQADAEAAAVWLDTANETDGAPTSVDTLNGEVARYEINATNSLPRNLRTKFIQDVEPSQTISDENYGKGGNDDGTTTSGTNGSVL